MNSVTIDFITCLISGPSPDLLIIDENKDMVINRRSHHRFPDFLIIGAARAGTTSFYDYLKQHPQIFMPFNKEPMFYALEGRDVAFAGPGDDKEINKKSITEMSAYLDLFRNARSDQIIGEASTLYFYHEAAAPNIKRHAPDSKLFLILRNPIDRAFSAYLYLVRDQRETAGSFEIALEEEGSRIRQNWEHIWHYKSMGYYGAQLERLYGYFSRDQVRVYLYEDLQESPTTVLHDAYSFLGIRSDFIANTTVRHNQGGVATQGMISALLTRPSKLKQRVKPWLPSFLQNLYINEKHRRLSKPGLKESTRKRLIDVYATDIDKLEQLIGRDLSSWKLGF